MSSNTKFDKHESNPEFLYQLLSRCREDCEFFLHHPYEDHLWGRTVEDHIKAMRDLYSRLPEKPDWLSEEDINWYEHEMKKLQMKY